MPVHRVRPDQVDREILRLTREGETVLHTHHNEDRNLVFIYTEDKAETR